MFNQNEIRYSVAFVVLVRSEVVMYVVERHQNGSSRTIPASDVFTHMNQTNIKVCTNKWLLFLS